MAKEEKTKGTAIFKSDLNELGALMKSDINQVKKDIQRAETELGEKIQRVETGLQRKIEKVETELKKDIKQIETTQDRVLVKLIEHDADIVDIKERLKKLDYFDDLMRGQDLMIGLLKKMLEEMAAFTKWSLRTND
ncbi:MAG: hypothetical protein HYY51_03425 [Candidatus Magasanikbacteria bacterium]|nr:hypothetical protein [Candidatus Magasanikbacteria bacterium]